MPSGRHDNQQPSLRESQEEEEYEQKWNSTSLSQHDQEMNQVHTQLSMRQHQQQPRSNAEKHRSDGEEEEEGADVVVYPSGDVKNDQVRNAMAITTTPPALTIHASMFDGCGMSHNNDMSNNARAYSNKHQQPATSTSCTHMHHHVKGDDDRSSMTTPPQSMASEGQNEEFRIDSSFSQVPHQQNSSSTISADQTTTTCLPSSMHDLHPSSHMTLQHSKVKVPKSASSRKRAPSQSKVTHLDASTSQQMHRHYSSGSGGTSTEENSGAGSSSPFAIVDETTRTRKKVKKKRNQLMTSGDQTEHKAGKVKIYAFERPLLNQNANFTENYFILTPTVTNANKASSSTSGNALSLTKTSISSSGDDEGHQASLNVVSMTPSPKNSQNFHISKKRSKKETNNDAKTTSTTHHSTALIQESSSSQHAPTVHSSNENMQGNNNNLNYSSISFQNQSSSSLEAQKAALGEFLKRFLQSTSSTASTFFSQRAQIQPPVQREPSSSNHQQQTQQEPQSQRLFLQQLVTMASALSGHDHSNQQQTSSDSVFQSTLSSLPGGGQQQVDPEALISIIDSILTREMTNRSHAALITNSPQSSFSELAPTTSPSTTLINSPSSSSFSDHDRNMLNTLPSSNRSNTLPTSTNLSFSNLNTQDTWEEQRLQSLFGLSHPPQLQSTGMPLISSQPVQQQQFQDQNQPSQTQQEVNIMSGQTTQQLLVETLRNFSTPSLQTQQNLPSSSLSSHFQQPQLSNTTPTTLTPSEFPNDPIYHLSFQQQVSTQSHNPTMLNSMEIFQYLRQASNNDPLKILFLQCLAIVQQQEQKNHEPKR